MPVFGFSLCRYLWRTTKIRANFLRKSLLHGNKRVLISGQVYLQSSWKLGQNKKDYSLTLKPDPLFDVIFLKSPKQSQRAIYGNQTTIQSSKLEPYIFFEVKNLIFRHFSKIWKFSNPCDVIKSNLGQKSTKLYTIFQLWWKNQIQQLWFFRGDIWYYGPLVISLSDVILKLGQKRPNIICLYYWWKKSKPFARKKGKSLSNCAIKKIRAVFPKEEGHIYVTCSNVWFYNSI